MGEQWQVISLLNPTAKIPSPAQWVADRPQPLPHTARPQHLPTGLEPAHIPFSSPSSPWVWTMPLSLCPAKSGPSCHPPAIPHHLAKPTFPLPLHKAETCPLPPVGLSHAPSPLQAGFAPAPPRLLLGHTPFPGMAGLGPGCSLPHSAQLEGALLHLPQVQDWVHCQIQPMKEPNITHPACRTKRLSTTELDNSRADIHNVCLKTLITRISHCMTSTSRDKTITTFFSCCFYLGNTALTTLR